MRAIHLRLFHGCMIIVLFLSCTLVAAAGYQGAPAGLGVAAAPPFLPQPLPPTGDCALDNIYYGAAPAGSDERPVLVFVHGLWGVAADWWIEKPATGPNTMYRAAYEAGYRTAFVSLSINPLTPDDCTATDMPGYGTVQSGKVLAQQLSAILEYYGVGKVEIIAHSKGGVDTQAAIVRWAAWSKINNVFMLGTPNQGSLLADLLHSPEGEWLHGVTPPDAATYSIQTSVMEPFRASVDASTLDDAINYYVGAGNRWQTPGSIFEITGPWLQEAGGDNDGIINVSSTALAGANPLFLQPWNHGELTAGTNSFPYIRRVLEGIRVYLPFVQSSAP